MTAICYKFFEVYKSIKSKSKIVDHKKEFTYTVQLIKQNHKSFIRFGQSALAQIRYAEIISLTFHQ